jgi:transposase
MKRVSKEDTLRLFEKLKAKNYSREDIASALGVSFQTVWGWSSKSEKSMKRVLSNAEYDFLNNMLGGS